jgi:hypothetical protein
VRDAVELRLTAASMTGWRWPVDVHHSDETPSMYSLPSVS